MIFLSIAPVLKIIFLSSLLAKSFHALAGQRACIHPRWPIRFDVICQRRNCWGNSEPIHDSSILLVQASFPHVPGIVSWTTACLLWLPSRISGASIMKTVCIQTQEQREVKLCIDRMSIRGKVGFRMPTVHGVLCYQVLRISTGSSEFGVRTGLLGGPAKSHFSS